jgi:hypothetical protein
VPGAGDALKGAIRGGKKIAGEATEAALEQGTKRVGTDAAEEVAETAARGTSPAGAAGTIQPKTTGEAFGPKSPRSPLGRDVVESVPDPDPTTYRNGLRPDTPVLDHIKARALGGDPVDPANLHKKAWSENARKGWHEGEYLRQRRGLMRQGLTQQQAEWVLEDYLRWIKNDIHATPVDPGKLNKLPSP